MTVLLLTCLLLENNQRIAGKIVVIELFACLNNCGVLLDKKPTHMGEEKSSCGVVGISVSLEYIEVEIQDETIYILFR